MSQLCSNEYGIVFGFNEDFVYMTICFKRPLGSRDIDDVGKDDLKGDLKELSDCQRFMLSVIQNNDRITVLKMTKKLKPLIKLLEEKLLIILLRYIDFYALSQTDKNLLKQI